MKYNIIIIGGGIVGLATALKIKTAHPEKKLLILEKEPRFAAHQTGNNSGVIHSGVYYKPGSLKALNCINGYNQLIEFCDREDIPYELCGKVIVATNNEELPYLDKIYQRGTENGLTGLQILNQEQLKEKEPYVNGIKGIFVPQTGIVDFKKVAEKYGEKIQELGGEVRFGEKVKEVESRNKISYIITNKNEYATDLIINCAGLFSDKIAALTEQNLDIRIVPFRGEYYEIKEEKQYLVNNLIYPVPDPNFPFLGVHFTRMINGGIEAGPNAVLAFAREGYARSAINLREFGETLAWPGFQKVVAKYWKTGMGEMYRSFSKSAFTKALQHLLPDIKAEDLKPGGAGVRAQACHKDGGLIDDFLILENEQAINVCNAPSPAATSSLSIGQTVASIAEKRF